MTCRTPLSGSAAPLTGPAFPPYSKTLRAHFAIGATAVSVTYQAERDVLIEELVATLSAALDAGSTAYISVKYCGVMLLERVDLVTFNAASYHHALFRAAVAENKTITFVIELSAAQVGALDIDLTLSGVQGNGCCRGPGPVGTGIMVPAGQACGRMSGDGELQGEQYPPYSTTIEILTDAAGNGSVEFTAERDTLIMTLIHSLRQGVALSVDSRLVASYCNTTLLDGAEPSAFRFDIFYHATFICGVAENKKLKFSISNGGNAVRHLLTLSGVQGAGCCR